MGQNCDMVSFQVGNKSISPKNVKIDKLKQEFSAKIGTNDTLGTNDTPWKQILPREQSTPVKQMTP